MQYFFPQLIGISSGHESQFFLGGTSATFNSFKIVERGKNSMVIPATRAPKDILESFIRPRVSAFGLDFKKINIMGVLNVTPDSFYDGNKNYKDLDFVKKGFNLISACAP